MDDLIKLLDKNLDYVSHEIVEDTMYIKVASNRKIFTCPHCNTECKRIHSHYIKTFQDLPIQDKKVIIILDNRKFFCENNECSNKTFSETFDCIDFKSKKSKRLIEYIINTSMKLSTIDASKVLEKNGVRVSKSTVHNLLKKIEHEIDYESPVIVCIDDFALKKRQTYGTILINLETRKIIDILNSRNVEDVTAWLKKFPNIKIVSRDGSYTYAKAISQALRTFYRSIEKIIDEQKDNIENDKEIKTISVISKIKALNFLKLLYLPIENIKELTQSTYNQIILKYPWIEEVLNIMKEFKTLVKKQNLIKYIFWLEKIKMLNIPELNSFIKSVERDNDAIINAIYYRYTNGLAEGFVNKLKTIKRSMYGKATFQGLRRKILWAERGK